MSSQPKYMEQYQRMKRSYALFDAIDPGRVHDRSSESYDDEVYTFFLNCYHLKDWIKNDVGAGVIAQNGIEQFIDSSRPLKLCADICNAHKHLQLNRSRSNENPQFATKHYALQLGNTESTTISMKYEIQSSTGRLDAFTLATQCIEEWDSFINSKCNR